MIRPLLFMLAEASWLLAPLVLLDAAMPAGAPVEAAVLLYPLGAVTARLTPIRDERLWVEIAVGAGLGLAAILLAALAVWAATAGGEPPVPRFLLAAAVGAVAWARGWLLARREPGSKTFALSFQFGLVVVAASLFYASDLGVPVPTQLALAALPVVLGLGGLWHARAGGRQGGPGNPGTALLGLGAVFALGALLWVLLDRSALEAGLAALRWLTQELARLLAALGELLPEPAPPTADMPGQALDKPLPQPLDRPEPSGAPPSFVGAAALALILAVVVIGGAVGLYHYLQALARAKRSGRTRGLVYGRTGGGVLHALKAFLARALQRLRRAAAAYRERWRESRREGSVRGRYRKLLARLARRGWPRRPDETPEEYFRRLAPQWPESAPHFASLTEAFVTARYGGREPDPARVEDLWRRLKPVVGKLRRANG